MNKTNPKEAHLYDDGGRNLPICKLCYHSPLYKLHVKKEDITDNTAGDVQQATDQSSDTEQTLPSVPDNDILSIEEFKIDPLQAMPSFQNTFHAEHEIVISFAERSIPDLDKLTNKKDNLAHSHLCNQCGRPEVHMHNELCTWPGGESSNLCPKCKEKQAMMACFGYSNINCPGHPCISCGLEWSHDYTCKREKVINVLCNKCASQAGADIFRHDAISKIAKYANGFITGEEAVKIKVSENNFIVRNLWKDENGNERPDANERLSAHILELEKQQEELRIKLLEGHRLGAEKRSKDCEKLTPEELKEYRKIASKPEKVAKKKLSKLETDEQANKEYKRKAWLSQRESICKDIMNVKKKLTKEQALVQAEKFMESQEEFIERKDDSI